MAATPTLEGYYGGFLHKEASLGLILTQLGLAGGKTGVGAARIGHHFWEKVLTPALIGLPPAAGMAAGFAHSKLTSPSELDKETVQQALLAAELDEFTAEVRRRQELQRRKEQQRRKRLEKPERSLHGV